MTKDYEAAIEKIDEYLEKKEFTLIEKHTIARMMDEQYWEEVKTEDPDEDPDVGIEDPEEEPGEDPDEPDENLDEEPEEDPDEVPEDEPEEKEEDPEESLEVDNEEIGGHEKKAAQAFQKPKVKIKGRK